jgi:ribosomal protein S12 methylthiotransferase accessory factor
MRRYYRLAPDVAVVKLDDGGVIFKSDVLGIKLEGASAQFLAEKVIPLLDGNNDVEYVVSQLKNVAIEDLQTHLEQLLEMGVLRCTDETQAGLSTQAVPSYFTNFLRAMGKDEQHVWESAGKFKVAVIGLDAHGTQTILSLVQTGIHNFLLVDPFPCDTSYTDTFMFLRPYASPGMSKQDCLKRYLEAHSPGIKIELGPAELTKATLEQCMGDCQLYIVCMDKGFSAVFYWVNQISVERGVAALYSMIRGHVCFAGPFVIPEKTSCYMCYKMRHLATMDNFDEWMSYEEYLNDRKSPGFGDRTIIPASIQIMAAVLSAEAAKYALLLGPLSLSDKVMEFNTLTLENKSHSLLCKPDCPVCQKKKQGRQHLGTDELILHHQPSALGEVLDTLISGHTGVLKSLEQMSKDISEPSQPFVFVANLANNSFLPKDKFEMLKCSGKGMDLQSARISAAGEAVERYSGTVYRPEEIVYGSLTDLDGAALDPRRLVLYSPDQYDHVSFMPFSETETIGWMEGYSLAHHRPIMIPAHGTLLNYTLKRPQELLFQATSNGLAAGGSLISAVLSAALEVIERDAFVISWHNRLPTVRFNLKDYPFPEMKALETAYCRRGVDLQFYLLPTDAPVYVVMCVSVQQQGEGPSIVVGLGCAFTVAKATKQALLEVGQIRPAIRRRMRIPENRERLAQLLEDPERVESLEDHDLLYTDNRHLHAFDFLFNQPLSAQNWELDMELSVEEQINALTRYCQEKETDLIYCNLTPPDMEALGLYTARVIIPGLQPIHFGWKNIRMGGDRLFELPRQMGVRKDRVPAAALNQFPHPLA